MKLLRKTLLPVAALMASVSITASAFAGDAAMNLANSMCKDGDVAGAIAGSAATPDEKAVALGEASRQLGFGQCAATQAAIDAALKALLDANPGNGRLQVAYNDQKNSGQKAKGDGIDGLYADDNTLADTLVTTATGETVSEE